MSRKRIIYILIKKRMNEEWKAIFDNEKTIKENFQESIIEIEKKPIKFFSLYWIFFLNICLSLFILIFTILLPIWILYA